MSKPIEQFKLNILEVRKLHDIYNFNSKVLSNGIDIDGLLRAQLVFVVSALDQYIHQVVIAGMKNILMERITSPVSFSKLLLGLDSVNLLLNVHDIADMLPIIEKDIGIKLGWKSFQQPDKISEALKMVCDKNIWQDISLLMNTSVKDIKEQLNLIVKRRDSIAHEADLDIVNQCQYPIDDHITKEAVNFIITVVFMIDSIVFDYIYLDTTFEKLRL